MQRVLRDEKRLGGRWGFTAPKVPVAVQIKVVIAYPPSWYVELRLVCRLCDPLLDERGVLAAKTSCVSHHRPHERLYA